MTEYARIENGEVVETRFFAAAPDPNPVKGLDWRPLIREVGEPAGYEIGETVIFRELPPPEPKPERPTVRKSTVQARLIEAGKMDAAYVLLTANPTYFARWFAPDRPVVYCDDPDAILVVTALELDPAVILAPETDQ